MGARKRKSTQRHAIRRARERYDEWLEIEDIQAFNFVVRNNLCRLIEKPKPRSRKVLLRSLSGKLMAAIYDPRKGTICTFLPWQAAEVRRAMRRAAKARTA